MRYSIPAVMFLIGGGVGHFAMAPAASSSHDPVPELLPVAVNERVEIHQLPSDCADRQEALQAEHDRLELAVNATSLSLRIAVAQRIEREGSVVEWTDDIPAAERPEAFEAALFAAIDAEGGEVLELDCSEYPCIATVLMDEVFPPGSGISGKALRPAREALEEQLEVRLGLETTSSLSVGEDSHQEYSTFFVSSSEQRNVIKRGQFRAEKQMEALGEELRGESP